MTLSDLLDELREGMLNDRTDRVEGTGDYLWTDKRLIRYINEAQRRFARRSLILRDGTTPEVTQITLVAGQTVYELHKSVIAVISARNQNGRTDLVRVGHSLLNAYRNTSETWIDPNRYYGSPPGPAVAYSTDEALDTDDTGSWSSVMLRVYPTPRAEDAGTVLSLRVVRLPINELTEDTLTAVPEVPEDYHLDMLDWAAYLALRIDDDDAGNPARAQQYASSFEVHVREAKIEAMRKMFAPMPWGFGRGGFTWER